MPVWDVSDWLHPGGSFVQASSLCGRIIHAWLARSSSHAGNEPEAGTTLPGGGVKVGEYVDSACPEVEVSHPPSPPVADPPLPPLPPAPPGGFSPPPPASPSPPAEPPHPPSPPAAKPDGTSKDSEAPAVPEVVAYHLVVTTVVTVAGDVASFDDRQDGAPCRQCACPPHDHAAGLGEMTRTSETSYRTVGARRARLPALHSRLLT